MKKKSITIIMVIAVICIVAVVLGMQGFSNANYGNVQVDQNKDLMVGVYLTVDSVHTERPDNGAVYYAELVEKNTVDADTGATINYSEYIFKDLEGYGFYSFYVDNGGQQYQSGVYDNAFCDSSVSYDSNSRSLESTIYYSGSELAFGINPVYQKTDGTVYTVIHNETLGISGRGITVNEHFVDSDISLKNGGFVKETSEIKLTIKSKDKIDSTEIIEMSEDGRSIGADVFAFDKGPFVYFPSEAAEYLVVSNECTDYEGYKYRDRVIVDNENPEFYIYKADENGIYIQYPVCVDF